MGIATSYSLQPKSQAVWDWSAVACLHSGVQQNFQWVNKSSGEVEIKLTQRIPALSLKWVGSYIVQWP